MTSGKLVWQGSAGAGFAAPGSDNINGRLAIGDGVLAADAGQRIVVFG